VQLEFTGEQEELRAAVRDLLAHECPTSLVRERVEKGRPATALSRQLTELGAPALTLPEQVGGLGLGPVEATVVAEELGRFVAPVPWLATVTQYAALIAHAGTAEQCAALLGPVAAGERVGTLAVAEDARHALPESMRTVARRAGNGWVLSGIKRYAFDAEAADEIAVVARVEGADLGVFVVPASQVEIEAMPSSDGSRQWASVALADVTVPADRALGEPGCSESAVRRALAEATAALATEIVGVCSALLNRTISYVQEREQFGVPVGSFQAVKHKLADCFVALERARAAAYFAAATLAEDDPRQATAVPMAKIAAGDAAGRIVQDAIQSHGGIGYTWEHDLHLFAKRAAADAAVFGTAASHRRALAAELGLAGARG
jgi:alkylation response protein AidB-like acyl-CoA dehydrogenase